MKTSELTEAALDWAVAKALGAETEYNFETDKGWLGPEYQSDWKWGGPIIERERFRLEPMYQDSGWLAFSSDEFDPNKRVGFGPSPLVAAMRCLVASKFGDEIEIPEELR